MQIYTYSEARKKLSSVLDKAEISGKVLIRRRDGRTFAVEPERNDSSPLDVPSIKARVNTDELVSIIRQGRSGSTACTRFLKDKKRSSIKS
jgi:antitoxin Phd